MNINIIMIDLHTHILYGIDDGAKDLKESLEMINYQINQGVKEIVLTPHFNYVKDDYNKFITLRNKNYKKLKAEVSKLNLDVKLKIASELLYTNDLVNSNLEELVIEGTDYLLIEFSTRSYPLDIKRNLLSLMDRGYLIILAHIERYEFFRSDLDLLYELVSMGILMQVNASTFINASDKNFINAAIKHNLIHLVSSDTHNLDTRLPNTKEALNTIRKTYGNDTYDYFINNAKAVLNNEYVEMYAPSKIKKIFNKYF